MHPVLYGIPNCDTVRKARKWLTEHNVDYDFVDLKTHTPARSVIEQWLAQAGAETLVNRRSTTWKQLDVESRQAIEQGNSAAILECNPTLIKRPVLLHNEKLLVGFQISEYGAEFGV